MLSLSFAGVLLHPGIMEFFKGWVVKLPDCSFPCSVTLDPYPDGVYPLIISTDANLPKLRNVDL